MNTQEAFRDEILSTVSLLSDQKDLHGFHFTGHGSAYEFGMIRWIRGDWRWGVIPLYRTEWHERWIGVHYRKVHDELNYKLGLVILAACGSGWKGSENPSDAGNTKKPDTGTIPANDRINGGGRDLFSEMPPPALIVGDKYIWVPTVGASNPGKIK